LIVAGHQPNYLPWLGFFDKIRLCDIFIIEDIVQFENNGFTNRNRIKVTNGSKWLTVPIEHLGYPLAINEVRIANKAEGNWGQRHWLTLFHNYSKAPFWDKYCSFFKATYDKEWTYLLDLNMHLLQGIMDFLEIRTPLVLASSLKVDGKKSELICAQCKALGGNIQLSGAGAREYLDVERFKEEGIEVVFQEFHYPFYNQLFGEFVPNLSVVDYLFCVGNQLW
jgi:hypothetical protein